MAAWHQNIPVAKLLIKANCDLHAVSTTIPESKINSDGIVPIARIVSNVPHGFTPLGVTCWKKEPSVEFGLLLLEAAAKAEKNVAFRRPLLCEPIKRRNEELGSNPSTLQCLAVNAVRSCLRGPHYRRKLASLELTHAVVLDLEFGNIK